MKHVKENQVKYVFPNPVDHYCDSIKNNVHITLENLECNPDNMAAFQNGQKTIDLCLENLDKIRNYLLIMRDIISDDMPLPF